MILDMTWEKSSKTYVRSVHYHQWVQKQRHHLY